MLRSVLSLFLVLGFSSATFASQFPLPCYISKKVRECTDAIYPASVMAITVASDGSVKHSKIAKNCYTSSGVDYALKTLREMGACFDKKQR